MELRKFFLLAKCRGSIAAEVNKYYFETIIYFRKLSLVNDQFVSEFLILKDWFYKTICDT